MKNLRNSACLLAIALAAVTVVAMGRASLAGPQEFGFQGTKPMPPGSSGGGVAFQGTKPMPPGSSGGGVSA
jgi:hypothetical protein